MADPTQISAPGLKWRNRAGSPPVQYWVAKPSAVASGYPLKTVNLSSIPPDQIAARCCALEAEMLDFLSGPREQRFDGTLGSLLKLYQTHEDSPYKALRPSSSTVYTHYLRRLIYAYGDIRLERISGLDVKGWRKTWLGADNRIGAASMAFKILKAAISFGTVSGIPGCDRTPRLPFCAQTYRAPSAYLRADCCRC